MNSLSHILEPSTLLIDCPISPSSLTAPSSLVLPEYQTTADLDDGRTTLKKLKKEGKLTIGSGENVF
jgi:hypothetical protein